MSLIGQILLPLFAVFFAVPEKIPAHNSPTTLHPGCVQKDHQYVVTNTSPQPIIVTAATGGSCSGNYAYQWQMSYDDVSFVNIPGATSLNLTYTGLITQTTYFQRRATCGNETTYTLSIEIENVAQLYYNTAISGTFTRNNCPSPNYSAPVTHSVAANTFSSPYPGVAQDEAVYELNTVGQAMANAVPCCSLTANFASGVSIANAVFSLSGSTVNYAIAVGWPGGSTTSMTLGTLNGTCIRPTTTRTINYTHLGASFQFSVNSSGVMTLSLMSGSINPGYMPCNGSFTK